MENAADEVVVAVNWAEASFLSKVVAFFGGRTRSELRGQLIADRTGLRVHAERVRGPVIRWAWADVAQLRLEAGLASYLVVDSHLRPRRRRFALLAGGHAMAPPAAANLIERMRGVASASGWSPSELPAVVAGDRAQRFAANTAAFVRRHPDAFVVRTADAPSGAARAVMTTGLAFASATRYGHLVADASGLRMYQGPNDIEWEKTWLEVMTVAMSDDGRALKLDALGWSAPKFYSPCEPNGDVLLPFAVRDVLRALQSRRPKTGVR